MQRRTIAMLLGLAALVAIAAGCGGSGSGSGSASSSAASAGPSSESTGSAGDSGGESADTGGDSTSSGDTDGSTASAAPLTKAEFIKQGDAICEKVPVEYKEAADALEKSAQSKPSPAETNLKAAVPPLRVASEKLEGLGAPSGDEAEIEAIVAALEEAAEGLEAKPESELSGPKSPFATFQKLTGEYGFKVCKEL